MANDADYFAIPAKHGATGIAHVDGCISLQKFNGNRLIANAYGPPSTTQKPNR
jgi:hypothetical protein